MGTHIGRSAASAARGPLSLAAQLAVPVRCRNPRYLSSAAAQPIMESMLQTTAFANDRASGAFSILKRGLCAVAGRGRPENRPLGQPDRRVNHRMKVRFDARISNESRWMRVRGVNMHAEGALVIASQPLAPQSVVFVQGSPGFTWPAE